MPTRNLEQEIAERTQAFVEEITALVREAALESVTNALSGIGISSSKNTEHAAARPTNGRAHPAPVPTNGRAHRAPKRSPEELEALLNKVLEEIQADPGQRAESIAQKLHTSSKELMQTNKKLLAADRISKIGEKRATTYYPV
jgi:hypothetical protein